MDIKVLDCTLRDGGYYNGWDFSEDLINEYLDAVRLAGVDVVELGFRSFQESGFRGACAYTTDSFISSLNIPSNLSIGVMVNASDLLRKDVSQIEALERLFPLPSTDSPLSLVRIACHVHEFKEAIKAVPWLKGRGFRVGFNLMQVADRSEDEIVELANEASRWAVDVLYFADSMGSMTPAQTAQIIKWLRIGWAGAIGVHTHDNMGMALQNTLRAIDEGATWVDATVTGMGRGPGNTQTEHLVLEIAERRNASCNIVPLMTVIRKYFRDMKAHFGWGTNTYYYLAGKHGIHPTFIQEMLADPRYGEEDILAVIEHLRKEGGKKFNPAALDAARHFYRGAARGSWRPADVIESREVLLLGPGPGISRHRSAIQSYIRMRRPYVIALNTQTGIDSELIDARVACHPVRLLADIEAHARLPQPLIAPVSMLPDDVKAALQSHQTYDYGISVDAGVFKFSDMHCVVPTSLVVAYALAVASSGRAASVTLAGFDGYKNGDQRNNEMDALLSLYQEAEGAVAIRAITPTIYKLPVTSVYAA